MGGALVSIELRGRAAWVTLERPERRNALSAAMLDELRAALGEAVADPRARVLVLTGRGSAFCAGADLEQPPPLAALAELLRSVQDCPKPVVAAVNGHAFAGGIGLVAAADVALAADSAVFAFSKVRLGVAPAVIAVFCLPRMGEGAARRLFLTGSRFDAEEARATGLVHAVVAADGLEAAAAALAAELALGAPGALAATKSLLARLRGLPRDGALELAAAVSEELFASDDAREGRAAFAERRRPRWAEPESV